MDDSRLRIGSWIVTPSQNLLECGTRILRLEPRLMDVLVALARSNGTPVSIDQMMSLVWSDVIVTDGSAYLAIRQLRQALGEAGDGLRYIETIPKRGYRLAVPAEPCDSAPGSALETPAPAAAATVPADDAQMPRARRTGWMWPVVLAGVIAVAGLVAVMALRGSGRTTTARSIAVLPLENVSPETGQDEFAIGITLELLHALSGIPDLRVTAPSSSLQLKGRGEDLRRVSATLDVEYVLQGAVRAAGDRVRVAVQLRHAPTGDQVWAQTYERRIDDIFQIQDDVAKAVADALQVTLRVGEVGRTPGMTHNAEAYREYLRAKVLNLEWRPDSFAQCVAHLQRAIAIDPSFAIAWSRLSTVYWNGTAIVPERADEWRKRAAEAIERAGALAPDAPEVLLDVGIFEASRWNWIGAERAFRRLHEASPRYGVADRAAAPRGVLLLAVGRISSAVPLLEQARAEDPLAPAIAGFLSAAYLAGGHAADASAEVTRGLTLEGLDGRLRALGLLVALTTGNGADIRRHVNGADTSQVRQPLLALARFIDTPDAAVGHIRAAKASATSQEKLPMAYWAAFHHQPDLALELLADAAPSMRHPGLLWQPLFRDVRRRPGFKAVVAKLGMVDYWRVYGWSDFCRPVSEDDFTCV